MKIGADEEEIRRGMKEVFMGEILMPLPGRKSPESGSGSMGSHGNECRSYCSRGANVLFFSHHRGAAA